MDPLSGPAIEGWSAATGRSRTRWVRTGVVAAALWAGLGLLVALLSARAGAPTASGWLALLTGPVVLFLVGRRARVQGRGDWILAGLLEFGLILVLGTSAIFLLVLGGALGGGSSVETVGFGTGGTDCTLETTASTFAPGDPIRVVADFEPKLATGTVVRISLALDGKVIESSRESLTLDAPAGCVSGALSDAPLAIGHYRWDISPDTAPAISGEFDIVQ